MRTYIRRREQNKQLVVFFGGWGTDENMFVPLCTDEFDFIMFYNYSADEALVLPETKTYEKITLIGWSLGVWAAEYLVEKTGIVPDISIAVNGTSLPVDDNYGIPVNVFEGTVNNITEENIEKFYLRVFGDKKTYLLNTDRVPRRTIKSLHDELRWMYNRMMEQKESGFRWTYAVASESDRVFPAKNLKNFWEKASDTKLITLPLPHYFFHEWDSYSSFISFVENYDFDSRKKSGKKTRASKGL
jgi:hypothetical protein